MFLLKWLWDVHGGNEPYGVPSVDDCTPAEYEDYDIALPYADIYMEGNYAKWEVGGTWYCCKVRGLV